jgi:acyl-CoA thioesterase-1
MNCLEKNGLKIFLFLFLTYSYSITADTKKLLILGDSISAGYGIKESENWVALLADNLNKNSKINFILINSSVSGDTTSGGVSRIKKALEVHSPDYVLIELGGNDALRGYPITNIQENLERIVSKVLEEKSKPILMQIKIPPNYGRRYVSAFENLYPTISKNYQIPLMDFLLENVALDQNLMQADGIHPNSKAQPIIAKQIYIEIKNILK